MAPRHADLRLGAEAGLVAALVSSIPGIAWVLAQHEPGWRPVQLIATLVGIDQLDQFDPAAFVVGGLLHLAISVTLGIALALVVPRTASIGATILAGLAAGAGVYVVNFEVTEALGWFDAIRAGTHDAVELAAHLVFGATASIWLAMRRRS